MTQARKLPVGKFSLTHRIALAGIAVGGIAVLLVAYNLDSDPRGFGTHEQLGLTPCYFQQWSGRVCPACGATTAWAYTVRGQIAQAAAVNFGGTLLCIATIITVPWLAMSASVGRWIVCRLSLRLLLVAATALLLIVLLDWLRRWYFS